MFLYNLALLKFVVRFSNQNVLIKFVNFHEIEFHNLSLLIELFDLKANVAFWAKKITKENPVHFLL